MTRGGATTRWVFVRALRFVDIEIPMGAVVEEIDHGALSSEEKGSLKRANRRDDDIGSKGSRPRSVAVRYADRCRIVVVGVDVRLDLAARPGILERRKTRGV